MAFKHSTLIIVLFINAGAYAAEKASTTYEDDKIEVSIEGKKCQSTLQSSDKDSTPSVSVRCYPNAIPDRQCNYLYSGITNEGEFSISEYQNESVNQSGISKKDGRQSKQGSSKNIDRHGKVSLDLIGKKAQEFMDKHCTRRDLTQDFRVYNSWSYDIGPGMPCSFDQISSDPGYMDTVNLYCYQNSDLSTQCIFSEKTKARYVQTSDNLIAALTFNVVSRFKGSKPKAGATYKVSTESELEIGIKTYQKTTDTKRVQIHEFSQKKQIPFKSSIDLKKIGEEWMKQHCSPVDPKKTETRPFPKIQPNDAVR